MINTERLLHCKKDSPVNKEIDKEENRRAMERMVLMVGFILSIA